MAPLSDLTMLTLEDAAQLVSVKARLGFSRALYEKQAMHPGLTGALIGGGLGLGTGLLSSAMSSDPDKRWGRNAIMGALLGAGVGGAAGMSGPLINTVRGKGDPAQDLINRLTEAKKTEVAARPPITDTVGNYISSALQGNWNGQANFDPATLAEMKQKLVNPQDVAHLAPKAQTGWDTLGEYTSRPGDTMASGAAGAVVGRGVDLARAHRVTPQTVTSLTPEQLKGVTPEVAAKMQEFRTNALQDGARISKPTRTAGPAITLPNRAGNPLGLETIPTPLNTWNQMKTQTRRVGKTPISGTLAGGAAGVLMAPPLSRAFHSFFGPNAPIAPPR